MSQARQNGMGRVLWCGEQLQDLKLPVYHGDAVGKGPAGIDRYAQGIPSRMLKTLKYITTASQGAPFACDG